MVITNTVNKAKSEISDDTVQQILSRLKIDENECLTSEQETEVKALITEYANLFCDDESSVAERVEHVIETGSARPIHLSPSRGSPKERQVIKQEIKKMMSNQIICPSRSPWSFPCILVKKKDNSVCFVSTTTVLMKSPNVMCTLCPELMMLLMR